MKLFLDLDGTLADFERHYTETIGPAPPQDDPNNDVDWVKIRDTDFFAGIPPMPDAHELWSYVRHLNPAVLTGCPTIGRDHAARHKRAWVAKHLGDEVEVLTVLAKEKSHHCSPGDVIVDNREKYKPLWVEKGGIWVTHTSAASSIAQLKNHGI